MKIPGLPNKSYRRSDAAYLSEQDILDIISMRNTIPNAAQIAAKKYKTSATRIYQIWKMQGEIKQQPLRGARRCDRVRQGCFEKRVHTR